MWFDDIIFFLAAIGALAGALGVVLLQNPFYSVLSLVCHLLGLAVLFLLLSAEFIAAAQVVVYAGAVMVLYVFVVAYVGGDQMPMRPAGGPVLNVGAIVFATALFVELVIAFLGSSLQAIDTDGAQYDPAFGTPGQIGTRMNDSGFPASLSIPTPPRMFTGMVQCWRSVGRVA